MNIFTHSKKMLRNVKALKVLNLIMNVYIHERRTFKLINHNKYLQKRLDITEEDFINYYKIIINVKIRKEPNEYSFFLPNTYYQSKKNFTIITETKPPLLIKRNYIALHEKKINKVRIIIHENVQTLKSLFQDMKHIEEINFIRYNRLDIHDVSNLFKNCTSLKKIYY